MAESYVKEIGEYGELLKKFRKDAKLFALENELLEIEQTRYKMLYHEVHQIQARKKTAESEDKIRELLRDVIVLDIPVVEAKVKRFGETLEFLQNTKQKVADKEGQINNCYRFLQSWLELHEGFWALASFRSLEHFAQFMEMDITDENKKVWKHSLDPYNDGGYTGVNKPFFHYFNQMVMKKDIKFISKQYPTGYGKCIKADTPVLTKNGYIPISDIQIGDFVASMKDNEIVYRKVTNKWNTRKKQVKIVTCSGKQLIVSPEHRLYTTKGYQCADSLTVSDYLYRNCSIIEQEQCYQIAEEELFFITCMLFEGHCDFPNLSFTQEKNEVYDKFVETCQILGFDYRFQERNGCGGVRINLGDGKVKKLLEKYGLWGKLSGEKRLPKQFFNLSLKDKYKFIGIMFATDGYMCLKTSRDIGIKLSSEKLIDDIQVLLETCGIYAVKNYKQIKANGKIFNAWKLIIPREYFEKIANNCYCYHKEQRKQSIYYNLLNLSTKPYCNRTNYPKEILANCKQFKAENNKQWARNKKFKRYIVEDFSKRTGLLKDVVYKDFLWDEIKSIEYIDELCDMVDIEVEETHNFVANGLVSHNSYSNQVAIAWLLGVDKENDVLIVLGNPALVSINANGILGIMTNPRFAKVFPEYAQYFDDGNVSDKMFSICRVKQGEICIEGTTRPMNVKIICKETPIDGIRVKFLFLDDVCRSKDANNLKAHEEDIKNFWDSWYKRNYGTDNFYIVAGGTAYSVEDILSHLIRYYSGGKLIRTNTNKYTYKNTKDDCVFIKIPKIDDDLNRSTYPQKFPYEEAVKARDRNYRMFMAMEQQQPLNAETCPFAWENLLTYEELPDGLSDYSVALLDPARSGQNYVSMAIFRVREERDKFNAVNKVYYLVDCVYRLKKMEDMYQEIVDKVEKHHIVKLHIENNTDTSLKNLLDKMFHEKHILFCETIEFYSTENKETKLKELTYKNWGYITKQMKFPCYNMYPPAHPMGKFMQHITCYDFKHKNDYDDSIDTVCMFIERFMANTVMFHKAKIVRV